jgi:hypothetical protein
MRRERALAGRNVVLQLIHVSWSKSARGGSAAERRNRIPKSLPLPTGFIPEVGRHLLIQKSGWGAGNDFSSETVGQSRKLSLSTGYREGCLSIGETADGAEVRWQWDESVGLPPRHFQEASGNFVPASHTMHLRDREWGKMQWNGRFVCIDSGSWWYESVTANVAVIPTADIPRDIFETSCPIHEFTSLELLR